MIAIVDYEVGNLRSVQKALEKVGECAEITSDAAAIARADKVVLPGVGAFGAAVAHLERAGLKGAVLDAIGSGRPFLGICVGMQLLFAESEEMGRYPGLGIIAGKVVRFADGMCQDDRPVKIPQIGWNSLSARADSRLLRGIPEGARVYFVHSYHGVPEDPTWIAATSHYGMEFCAAVERGNIFATQFHPEKSGDVGLSILSNFAEL